MRIDADDIIHALGGDARSGMCKCPVAGHADATASLHVSDSGGKALWHCHAGCSQKQVYEALLALGLGREKSQRPRPQRAQANNAEPPDEFERWYRPYKIIRAATVAKLGPPVDYLAGRGITVVPDCTMVLPANDAARLTGRRYPAMVVPIITLDADAGRPLLCGAHITWLDTSRRNKLATADGNARRMYGGAKGGFVQLGELDPDRPLIVGEGIETTLAAMQISGLQGIAALSASGLAAVRLPPCGEVILAADNDEPGRKAAAQLAERLEFEGHTVTIACPPNAGWDWNDVLNQHEGDDARQIWTRALDGIEREKMELSHPVEAFMELTFPKREMLMAPWLPQPGIAMLFARAGHAKTYTALGIAYAVARGDEFLGWKCERPGRVLYVDGEMPGGYLQRRLALYGPAPRGTLHIVCRDTFNLHRESMPDLGTPDGRRVLDDIIKRVKPDLVILDSLSTLVRSGEENSAEDWRPVQDWLMGHRWRGRSMLIVHHAGKSGDYRGTSKIIDTPETIIKLTKQIEVEKADDESAFELEFIKGRELFGGSEEPLMIWLAIRAGRIEWRHEQKRDRRRDQIREMLRAGTSQADIAKTLGISRVRVTQIIGEMKKADETVVPFPDRPKR